MNERMKWLDDRRTGIGGSDVAPILGLSKWRTPLDVYLEKRGESVEQTDNEPMRWGRALEPVIRQAYCDATGRSVFVPGMMRHAEHRHMIANVDGIADGFRLFEAKTARTAEGWGEPGTGEIPDAYLLQVQHYMVVTSTPIADVAVLIGGQDFRIYTVDSDDELQAAIIEAEAAFWQRVQDAQPPEPITFADAVARFGKAAATGTVEATEEVARAVQAINLARSQIKLLEAEEEAAKAIVMKALGDAGDTLTLAGKTLATWKLAKAPERFDANAFCAAHPDLAKQFTIAGTPSRRLLIK